MSLFKKKVEKIEIEKPEVIKVRYVLTVHGSPDSIYYVFEDKKKAEKEAQKILINLTNALKKREFYWIPNLDGINSDTQNGHWINPISVFWVNLEKEEYEE
jgi:DUF1365 family protein